MGAVSASIGENSHTSVSPSLSWALVVVTRPGSFNRKEICEFIAREMPGKVWSNSASTSAPHSSEKAASRCFRGSSLAAGYCLRTTFIP